MQILIVDDSKVSRYTLRALVESLGHYVVAEVINGQDGINKFKQFKPQIILTDIEMPEMDGISMISKIKQRNNVVKIIAVMANINKTKIHQTQLNGADDVLAKPTTGSLLNEIIKSICQ